MLTRFAITPGALAEAHCSSPTALELGIGCLHDLCRAEGIFTDLREGDWSRSADLAGPLAKRFLTFARKEHRLVGINVPNGFDIATDPTETSIWLRLGPADRDKQQKEFDPACGVHRFVGNFEIGG